MIEDFLKLFMKHFVDFKMNQQIFKAIGYSTFQDKRSPIAKIIAVKLLFSAVVAIAPYLALDRNTDA